ncbi:MAG: GMC family oxidoreductase, partial [Janthinobacterium lividum]
RALLDTELVTPPTRAALMARLEPSPPEDGPRFFADHDFFTLTAALTRLFADPEHPTAREMALAIDTRLAGGKGDGWRYNEMPPDTEAASLGLRGLDQSAQALEQTAFVGLSSDMQDAVLSAVQAGNAPGEIWQTLPGSRYFEDLLAEATACYYSHPIAQEEIGYVGMADGYGWTKVSMNEREPWEPEADHLTSLSQGPVKLEMAPSVTAAAASAPSVSGTAYELTDSVDAVVIGTGAGGAPLMARLAAAGLKVVALEAGKFWNPAHDFATDERAQEKLFWNDERLSAGGNPLPFGSNNSGIGVGGSTLHYTAYTPRAHADDFKLFTEFGVGADWPLDYADLEPYYDELEQFLGVSGPSPYLWDAHGQPYPLAPLPLNGAAQLMQRACETMGIATSPGPNAALSAPYYQPGVGWRKACTNRGFCQAGCSIGAKASMDVTFIPIALQNGAELRSECFVTQIETDKTGQVTGVVYTQDGREQRQLCRNVFLCAGAIETPRLLLLNDLANYSGQVGRNFMAHTAIQLWGQFAEDIRPYKGIPGGLISEDTHRPKDADFAGGYLLQSIGVMPVTYATQLARAERLWGDKLRRHMRGYNHVAGLNICGDCLPYENNFLELSDETDVRGLPKPRIHFTAGENEKRMTAHGEKIMRALWAEAGASEVWALERYAHIIGTCRMGADPATSVVNADGQAHDVPGLFIADNSVFSSALSVNPALTIMALSLRVADRFLSKTR